MLKDNVKLIKHDDKEEQFRKTEFLREMLEMRDMVIDINGFNHNEIQDMIDHVSTMLYPVWFYLTFYINNFLPSVL